MNYNTVLTIRDSKAADPSLLYRSGSSMYTKFTDPDPFSFIYLSKMLQSLTMNYNTVLTIRDSRAADPSIPYGFGSSATKIFKDPDPWFYLS